MTDALNIVNTMLGRVEAIAISGGFNTNMGDHASIADSVINPDEISSDGVVIVWDTDENNSESDGSLYRAYENELSISIEGHIAIGTGNPVTLAHEMIEDIKQAVLLPDNRTLDDDAIDLIYLSRETNYPEPTGTSVSVRLNFNVRYMETYGTP